MKQSIAQMLLLVENERHDNWNKHVPHVESAYNNSVGSATGLAPDKIHVGRTLRLPPKYSGAARRVLES